MAWHCRVRVYVVHGANRTVGSFLESRAGRRRRRRPDNTRSLTQEPSQVSLLVRARRWRRIYRYNGSREEKLCYRGPILYPPPSSLDAAALARRHSSLFPDEILHERSSPRERVRTGTV